MMSSKLLITSPQNLRALGRISIFPNNFIKNYIKRGKTNTRTQYKINIKGGKTLQKEIVRKTLLRSQQVYLTLTYHCLLKYKYIFIPCNTAFAINRSLKTPARLINQQRFSKNEQKYLTT